MGIQHSQGDLLKQDVEALVNTVNCVGVMGRGIALQFKRAWPDAYKAYKRACDKKQVKLGRMFVYPLDSLTSPRLIVHFPTKDHWKEKSRLSDIQSGLDDLVRTVREREIRSIAVPPLGCGAGGLQWGEVRPLIEQAFAALPQVEVRLFAPEGAPPPHEMRTHKKPLRMTPVRAAVVRLMAAYRSLDYALTQTEVQKLVYFFSCLMPEHAPKLGFEPNQFGPYSRKLWYALDKMEGIYIQGLGDGNTHSELTPAPEAVQAAEAFCQTNQPLGRAIQQSADLVEGFESPYAMELLATLHWVATHPPPILKAGRWIDSQLPPARTLDEAERAAHAWSERKKRILRPEHIRIAWQHLQSKGMLPKTHTENKENRP